MNKRKIFILIPDGIGLRNFAYSSFPKLAKKQNLDVVYWNSTLFSLKDLGLKEVLIKNAKIHPFTDVLKNARKQIELNLSIKKFNDSIYNTYRFKTRNNTVKKVIKNIALKLIVGLFSSEKGLKKVRKRICRQERKTLFYNECLAQLKQEKPDFVLCTNQRIVNAVAPLLAAKDLGIPTATFIFSWDNLPKATLVVEVDYYFVWSDFMKKELIRYYPHISVNQIKVTGTPQFETHFNNDDIESKSTFFNTHKLDLQKKYICFSGDDETTSPDDPAYLRDVAKTISTLNKRGFNLGLVFRRCPVDFSTRYDTILEDYKDIITEIKPKWSKISNTWNTILPTKADTILLSNTIAHTEIVINLGSSMVFDYAAFSKPCIYLNYNQNISSRLNWDIHHCYKYVHFRSMPEGAVVWFNNKAEIGNKIERTLKDSSSIVEQSKMWFDIIHVAPHDLSSKRILQAINTTLSNKVD